MADLLSASPHMTARGDHQFLYETYIGQAHIAGTGPQGRTCRECVFWYNWAENKDRISSPAEPQWHGRRCRENALMLKDALCNCPIINKVMQPIPHNAKACRLFREGDNIPPAQKTL